MVAKFLDDNKPKKSIQNRKQSLTIPIAKTGIVVGEEENRSLFFLSRARKERKEKENNVCVQATFCEGRKQALTKFSFFF